MHRRSSQRMASAAFRLAGLSTITCSVSVVNSGNTEVLLEGAVFQFLGHPRLDMLVKLTAVDATLLALSLSNDLPSSLKGVGTKASCVKWHLCTMNSTIDKVEVWCGESEAARVDFI
jgi:hypothetical protein